MNNVNQFLLENNIDFTLHKHPAVYTCEEAEKYCSNIPGIPSKNLLLRNKKANRYFLLVLPATKKTDLKKFEKLVGEKISFANSEALKEKLDLDPGSVSPFGLINDTTKSVEVYIDSDIYNGDIVSFHPNINTETLELSKDMFHKFLQVIDHKVNIINL